MKSRTLLLLYTLGAIIICQTPKEFNDRAFGDINRDPSVALYYSDAAIKTNIDKIDIRELVRSNYYKFLVYKKLELNSLGEIFLLKAQEINSTNNYIYRDINYIKDIFSYFLNNDIQSAEDILNNSSLSESLDQRDLIAFKILDLERAAKVGEDLSEIFSRLSTSAKSFGYKDLESEIYLIMADSFIDSDPDSALTLLNKVIDLKVERYITRAYLGTGEIYRYKGNNYRATMELNRAYLNAQLLSNDNETLLVGDKLVEIYESTGNYKDKSVILKSILDITRRRSNFLLRERREVFEEDYEKSLLREESRKSSLMVTILIYIVIILSVALICVVVFLSIQTYRLRHLKLGNN